MQWSSRLPRSTPTNKWAYGVSDTLALGLLNEAIGTGLPVMAYNNPGASGVELSVQTIARLGNEIEPVVPALV